MKGNNMNLTQAQIEAAKTVACEKCGCEIMKSIFVVKSISALLMPDGKEAVFPVPAFACNKCDHVNSNIVAGLGLSVTKE